MAAHASASSRNPKLQYFFSSFPFLKAVFVALILGLSGQTNVKSQSLQWGLNFRAFDNLALCLDSSSNAFVGGSFTGTVDLDPGAGTFMISNLFTTQDGYISNLDQSGNFLWGEQLSGSSYQQVLDLMADPANNLYACGNDKYSYGMVQKRNPNHLLQWTKYFYHNSSSNSFSIQCTDMALDPAGYLYVTGYHRNFTTFSSVPLIQLASASETMFIAKMDTMGNVLWVKQTYTPTDFDDCIGMTIAIDSYANLFIYGRFDGTVDFDPDTSSSHILTSSGFFSDTFLMKLDSSGNFNWVVDFPHTGFYGNNGMVLSDDIILITGNLDGSADFDPGPAVQTIPGMNQGTFILNLDTMRNFNWVKGIEGYCSGQGISTDAVGNMYVCGSFSSGYYDFDPGPGTAIDSSLAGRDGYVLKLNQAGQYMWHGKLGGSWNSDCKQLAVDASGAVFVSGTFTVDMDLDPFSNVLTVSDTVSNAFLIKIGQCGYTSQTIPISGCDTAWYNGIPFSNSGPHFLSYLDVAGCDSTIIIDADVFQSYYLQYSLSGCDSVIAGGQTYMQSGNYVTNFLSVNGCDSTVVYYINVYYSSDTTLFYNGCDSVVINNQAYYSSQQINQILTTSHGCDSLVTTEITVLPSYLVPITINVCDSVTLDGITYAASGIYSHNLVSVSGCDSVVQYNISIANTSFSSVTASACDNLVYNGIAYTTTGTYTQIIANASGCDSIITLNASILVSTSASLNLNGCDSVTYAGQVFYNSGIYMSVIPNAVGCDSIVTLNATVTDQDTTVVLNGVTLISLETGGTFQWVDCANGFTPIAGATLPTFTPLANGSYAVILNQSGCIDTSACHNVIGVWISETGNQTYFELYPNPANGQITIRQTDISYDKSASVWITDLSGKILFESPWENPDPLTIGIHEFAAGLYFLKIVNNTQSIVLRFEVVK